MGDRWWKASGWNDADETRAADENVTHRCRVCDHGTRIATPQRRTEHYCRECDAFRRFTSVIDDAA